MSSKNKDNIFSSTLHKFDMFKTPINLCHMKKDGFSTVIGGLLSLVVYAVMGLVTANILIRMVNLEDI